MLLMYPFSKYLSHCPVDYRTISHLMCWLAMLGYFKIAPPSANSVCVFLNCLCTVQDKALKYHTVDLFKSGRMEDPVLVFVHTSPFTWLGHSSAHITESIRIIPTTEAKYCR